MSNSMENVFPDYKISPDHQKKIARALESGRFNDSREFVFRAIDVFLAWESNPQMAMGKMTEMSPTIAQYAFMQGMMDANALKQMYPGYPEAFGEEWDEFLQNNPNAVPQQESTSMGDAQNQQKARKHKGDLQILRGRQEETREYIKQIDFKEISLKDEGFEEITFDGWPLLHTHYSRFLPAKIGVSALADLMYEQKKPVVTLNTFRIAGYDIAEEASEEIHAYEKENKITRTEKISTGLPKPYDGDITAKEALAEQRWKDKVFGKMRKSKETGNLSFEGELMALGLIKIWRKNKEFQVTLSELGKAFVTLENPVIDNKISNLRAFYEPEKEFIARKILPQRELELKVSKAAITIVQESEVLSGEMADYLDKVFKDVIEEFCEKKSIFSDKIRNDFLKKKKAGNDPIEGLRAATMGRLAELTIVSWEIDENSKSVYKIRDDKLADSVLKTK
ncbi:MAG: hypothetical protein CL763_10170 [Chloroflexi bacterium]|nr:hypothetical protein [Chloroflexota bacterium]